MILTNVIAITVLNEKKSQICMLDNPNNEYYNIYAIINQYMKLKNPFPQHKRELFYDVRYVCGNCGGNGSNCGGIELHHILGRCSASVFNAIPLCKQCHSQVGHTIKEHKKYLKWTLKYVCNKIRLGQYIFDKEDITFLQDNLMKYE